MAFSGGSALAPKIEEFLRVALCSFFAQGYGLTETCGSSFFSNSSVWVGSCSHNNSQRSQVEVSFVETLDCMQHPLSVRCL